MKPIAMLMLILLTVWNIPASPAQSQAKGPQRTIRRDDSTRSSPAEGGQPAPDSGQFTDAYRKQWERMSESERKTILNMGGYTPEQYQRAVAGGGQGLLSTSVPEAPKSTPGLILPRSPEPPGGAALPNLDRSLANLDAIRDRYIDRAGNSKCPPDITARMADLKWKLGQKGVAVSSFGNVNVQGGDLTAISKDWFRTGEASSVELLEASIEDILPVAMLAGSSTGKASRPADEDVTKMRTEFEALSAACAMSDQPSDAGSKRGSK